MSLKTQITDDMKTALRAGDKPRLSTVRLILAAINQREVDERIELDDAQVLAVLDKMLKQRRESIIQYAKGARADLVASEQAEVALIQGYLPAQLSDSELDALIAGAVQASGAASMRDMGKVMGLLKPKVQGRADMAAVSARIKAKLGR
ncbi:MAG: GatB/YqeY domain-containing protein [Gammaproteobacteria bacterium]